MCGIAARHVRLLKSRYHIYMLDNGRYVQDSTQLRGGRHVVLVR